MGKPSPAMSVAVVEQTAFIRIPGRANFTSSIEFKALITELRARGTNRFILDLANCVTMDSTFLGVLAGLALRNADGRETNVAGERLQLELRNPNERVAELLDNLGVVHLFNVIYDDTSCATAFEPVRSDGEPAPSREEVSRNCLEAHQLLMRINPDNVPKFKEVTQFLAEDLRKMREGGSSNS